MDSTSPPPAGPQRRTVLQWAGGGALATLFAPSAGAFAAAAAATSGPAKLGFRAPPAQAIDALATPEGYRAQVLAPWGEPVGIAGQMPAFRFDASNPANEQAVQMGMHHDGLQYFPLDGSHRGLLVMNHEYLDDGLLHSDGTQTWSAAKVAKAQAAMGLSVIEVERDAQGSWKHVQPSRYARRVTANTPMLIGGPAAGHALMKTAADPAGSQVLGTLANCGCGKTPWGTYLSGEENFQGYFRTGEQRNQTHKRWNMRSRDWARWAEHDERFDAQRHPNEPNRFGWIVELDPMDPASVPVKRTALGRGVHEGAWVTLSRDGRAVVYSEEDDRFEHITKFVSKERMRPAGSGLSLAQANRHLLDEGTLYVARFDAGGRGRWLPMVAGQGPLTPERGFADQGEVCIKAREAGDALGATKMDRPEWIAIDEASRWVYCALTNNHERGRSGFPASDAANPRAGNSMGHIIRWREDGDFDGLGFEWEIFALAGDPANERDEAKGNVKGDPFGSPDSLAFGPNGLLWVGSDISQRLLNTGEQQRLGNNALYACDPASGEVRRFLVGPMNAEVCGAAFTPDGQTLFVNIQHPGEAPGDRNDAAQPRRFSNWPDQRADGRPRSATVAVHRVGGGIVGS
jgi:secreted PhoX family phosphatase